MTRRSGIRRQALTHVDAACPIGSTMLEWLLLRVCQNFPGQLLIASLLAVLCTGGGRGHRFRAHQCGSGLFWRGPVRDCVQSGRDFSLILVLMR